MAEPGLGFRRLSPDALEIAPGFMLSTPEDWQYLRVQLGRRVFEVPPDFRESLGGDLPLPGKWVNRGDIQIAWRRPGFWLLGGTEASMRNVRDSLLAAVTADISFAVSPAYGLCSLDIKGAGLAPKLASLLEQDISSLRGRSCLTTRFGDIRATWLVHSSGVVSSDTACPDIGIGTECRVIIDSSYLEYALERFSRWLA